MINYFYAKAQKGMSYLGRFYRKDRDGDWEEADRALNQKCGSEYVKTRINKELMKKAKNKDMSFDKIDIDENLYFIVVYAKNNSKKYEVFIDQGFSVLNGVIGT